MWSKISHLGKQHNSIHVDPVRYSHNALWVCATVKGMVFK